MDKMIVGGVDVLVDPIMVTGFPFSEHYRPIMTIPLRQVVHSMLIEMALFLVKVPASDIFKLPLSVGLGFGQAQWFLVVRATHRITDSPPDGQGAAQSMIAASRILVWSQEILDT